MRLHSTERGQSGRAAVQWTGVNASDRLARTLSAIEGYRPELDTSLPIFDYIGQFGIEEKPSPMNIDRLIAELNETSPRLGSILRALSRMVLTPTMVSGGVKSNSVPEEIKLTCDIRTLPFQDEEYVRQQLDQAFEGIDGLEYEIDYMSVPNSSEFDTELTEAIKKPQAPAFGRADTQ